MIVVSGGGARGASSGWVRSVEAPARRFLPTVAHILYDQRGRLWPEVRLGARRARVHAVIRLPELRTATADAALIEPDPNWSDARFEPGAGHLRHFVPGFAVQCRLADGRLMTGRLARKDWAGRMAYSFGARRVTGQWIVAVDHRGVHNGTRPLKRGDSGLLWVTTEGAAVGIQIGMLSGRPFEAIVTPFETFCRLFKVRVAGT